MENSSEASTMATVGLWTMETMEVSTGVPMEVSMVVSMEVSMGSVDQTMEASVDSTTEVSTKDQMCRVRVQMERKQCSLTHRWANRQTNTTVNWIWRIDTSVHKRLPNKYFSRWKPPKVTAVNTYFHSVHGCGINAKQFSCGRWCWGRHQLQAPPPDKWTRIVTANTFKSIILNIKLRSGESIFILFYSLID